MSALIYPRGTDLSELSLSLLWYGDWPPCMECGGPLMRMTHDRADVKHAGACRLDGNAYKVSVRYVALGTHFNCVCCAEYHNISWYFFYNPIDDGAGLPKYQLDSSFYAVVKAPRLDRERINPETQQLLRGMRIS